MRYLILLQGTNPPTPPPAELMEAIMKLGADATKAGVLLDTAGLMPSAMGAIAARANPGFRRKVRSAYRTSLARLLSI